MIDLQTVRPGRTIYIPFETFGNATPSSITMSGFAVGDIRVYKDGGTTQRASTSGYTLLDTDGIDFDGITGIHGFSIDLSDNTTADFWQAGSRYFVVVSTITVDSQTMSFLAAQFAIGYDAAVLNTFIATLSTQTSFTLNVGPAEDNALVGHWVAIHDAASAVQYSWAIVSGYTGASKTVTLAAAPTFTIAAKDNISFMGIAPLQPTVLSRTLDVSSTGEAGVDWANVGSPTTTLNLSGTTTAAVSGAVGSVTGAVGSVTGNVGGNVSGSVGSVTGAVGSVTGNVGGNVTGSVGSVAAGGITASSIAADAITDAKVAADVTIASVTGAVGSVTGNVGGNVVGSVGSVTGAVGSVTGNVGGNVVGSVASVTAAVAVTSSIKKNQALAGFTFVLVDSSDHVTGKTSVTVTAQRSLDGAAFASCANSVTEISAGAYKIDLAAADLNGNSVLLKFSGTGADTRFIEIVTQP